MITPPDDGERVRALQSYNILDTPADELFDQLTQMAANALEVPISMVSLVDAERQWFKSKVGLDVSETDRDIAFCNHAIRHPDPFIVGDALEDTRFADNPLVLEYPGIRFYAGIPIFSPDGHGLGTLCVIDRVPRSLSDGQIEQLGDLARLAGYALEMHRKSTALEQALECLSERKQRNELLASMVVHDLKGPLTGILGLASIERLSAEGETADVFDQIISSAERIERMAMDVLDLCLSEAGELPVRPALCDVGALVAEQVGLCQVTAQRTGRTLVWHPSEVAATSVDPDLVSRVVANLLDNAIRHAPKGTDVRVELVARSGEMEITVADLGPGVSAEDRARVFEPHVSTTGPGGASRHHGLGLAFCKLAVEAHGGSAEIDDNHPTGAIFRVTFPPIAPPQAAPDRVC